MNFRAERVDKDKVYQDSGVAASMIGVDGTLCTWYGVIELILDVALSHVTAPAVFFLVRWYKPDLVAPDPKCRNVLLIQASATDGAFLEQSSFVSADKVVQQVCFTRVPDMISHGHPWIWVLQYESSSFLTAPHLLQEGGEPGDDSCVV